MTKIKQMAIDAAEKQQSTFKAVGYKHLPAFGEAVVLYDGALKYITYKLKAVRRECAVYSVKSTIYREDN